MPALHLGAAVAPGLLVLRELCLQADGGAEVNEPISPLQQVRCWRCDRLLLECSLPVKNRIVVICDRCSAKNVILPLDKGAKIGTTE